MNTQELVYLVDIENTQDDHETLSDRLQELLVALERQERASWFMRGAIYYAFESKRLWQYQGSKSFPDWVSKQKTYSRAAIYQDLQLYKELKSLPAEKLAEVPRNNAKTLRLMGESQRAEHLDDAIVLPPRQFEQRPELHNTPAKYTITFDDGTQRRDFRGVLEEIQAAVQCSQGEACERLVRAWEQCECEGKQEALDG